MKRWFYILLGGLGMGMALASAFMLWYAPVLPPPYMSRAPVCEWVLIGLGLGLCWLGLVNGRRAGEFDIAAYIKSSRKRDHHVSGTEIEFACPICHKVYRASPLLAGKPFTCRDCREAFDVPEEPGFPPLDKPRLLPGAG